MSGSSTVDILLGAIAAVTLVVVGVSIGRRSSWNVQDLRALMEETGERYPSELRDARLWAIGGWLTALIGGCMLLYILAVVPWSSLLDLASPP